MTALAALPPLCTTIGRLGSVLVVDRIEPNLDFWVDRLGFEVRSLVQGESCLEFAVLVRGDVKIMFRTRDLNREGTSGSGTTDPHRPWVVHYLQVDEPDENIGCSGGVESGFSQVEAGSRRSSTFPVSSL